MMLYNSGNSELKNFEGVIKLEFPYIMRDRGVKDRVYVLIYLGAIRNGGDRIKNIQHQYDHLSPNNLNRLYVKVLTDWNWNLSHSMPIYCLLICRYGSQLCQHKS